MLQHFHLFGMWNCILRIEAEKFKFLRVTVSNVMDYNNNDPYSTKLSEANKCAVISFI